MLAPRLTVVGRMVGGSFESNRLFSDSRGAKPVGLKSTQVRHRGNWGYVRFSRQAASLDIS